LSPANGQPIDLAYTTEIVSKDQTGQPTADIDAPIVFAGYGIDAPEYRWNDYAGVDVKGKIVLVIANEPPSNDPKFFKGPALTYYGRWTYKYEEAARRGAVGVLIIHRTDLASYGWEVVRNSQAVEKSYLEGDPTATLRAAAWIQHGVAQRLFTLAGLGDVDQAIDQAGKPGRIPCCRISRQASRAHREPGSPLRERQRGGPRARRCFRRKCSLLYRALRPPRHRSWRQGRQHLQRRSRQRHRLRHSARACAGLRAVSPCARPTTSTSPQSPPRSRTCSVRNSSACIRPFPPAHITLDLNYDMLLPIGIPRSVSLGNGAERIDFWPTIQTVAKAFDLALLPDPTPSRRPLLTAQTIFRWRATGIPALSIGQGKLFEGHDEAWGKQQSEDYVQHHYHQPSDEYRADWDFRGNAKMAQFGFVLGWLASEQPKPSNGCPETSLRPPASPDLRSKAISQHEICENALEWP
jgi:hypothetical protein